MCIRDRIRADIRDFKAKKNLDKVSSFPYAHTTLLHVYLAIKCNHTVLSLQVIVLWTANTERFCDVAEGLNDTAENLLRSISSNKEEVSPSTIFAVASVLEGVSLS